MRSEAAPRAGASSWQSSPRLVRRKEGWLCTSALWPWQAPAVLLLLCQHLAELPGSHHQLGSRPPFARAPAAPCHGWMAALSDWTPAASCTQGRPSLVPAATQGCLCGQGGIWQGVQVVLLHSRDTTSLASLPPWCTGFCASSRPEAVPSCSLSPLPARKHKRFCFYCLGIQQNPLLFPREKSECWEQQWVHMGPALLPRTIPPIRCHQGWKGGLCPWWEPLGIQKIFRT